MSTFAPDIASDVDSICFEADAHAYKEADGTRRMSTTQAIKIAGLIDYSMVRPDVLQHAAWRGSLVHHATALFDHGESLSDYDVPEECAPYIAGYQMFRQETRFEPIQEWIEKPSIVEIAGQRVGMTPDRIGMLDGIPTVLEIKCTAARHPAWGIQLASYEAGAPRPKGYRHYQRIAVQLLPSGKYKLWPYEDVSDFDTFCDAFRIAAWKLKHGLVKLD